MYVPVQIVFRNIARSDALAEWIRETALKLEVLDGRLTSCHVCVEELERHPVRGRQFVLP